MKVERINSKLTWHSKNTSVYVINVVCLLQALAFISQSLIDFYDPEPDNITGKEVVLALAALLFCWGITRLLLHAFTTKYLDEVWLDKPQSCLIVRNGGEETTIPLRHVVSLEEDKKLSKHRTATIELNIISKFGETLHFELPSVIRLNSHLEPHPDVLLLEKMITENSAEHS